MIYLPKNNFSVRIGPYLYEVIYSHDTSSMSDSYASISHNDFRIFIDPDQPGQRRISSFLHEVFHGLIECSVLYRLLEEKDHRVQEEDITTVFGNSFYQFMLDNKKLFIKPEIDLGPVKRGVGVSKKSKPSVA